MTRLENKFWLVWSPTGSAPPKYRHRTPEAAIAEAERLAIANPGKEFIVLGSEAGRLHDGMTKTTFIGSDEVPF